jgi:hypothetical protein
MYGDAPFFPASIRQRDGLSRRETLLSPYYALRDSPTDPRNALERPNILAACSTWENKLHIYYRDAVQNDASYIKNAPPTMFYPGTGHVVYLSERTVNAKTAPTVTSGSASRHDSTISSISTPEGGQRHTTETRKGKQKIFAKATRPLLRYVNSSPQGHGSASTTMQKMSDPPKFPSIDTFGAPGPLATHICLAFTTADAINKGCYCTKCKWAHLDAGALPPGTKSVHFASLRRAITSPLTSAYAFTTDGENVRS